MFYSSFIPFCVSLSARPLISLVSQWFSLSDPLFGNPWNKYCFVLQGLKVIKICILTEERQSKWAI
jgi:hypothetical protein